MAFKLHQGGVDEVVFYITCFYQHFLYHLLLAKKLYHLLLKFGNISLKSYPGVGLVPQDVRAGTASGYSREKRNPQVHKVLNNVNDLFFHEYH